MWHKSNIDYHIYHMFNAFPPDLTSVHSKISQNPRRPMGIHHSPHTHPIPIPTLHTQGSSADKTSRRVINETYDAETETRRSKQRLDRLLETFEP